jgi:hypothetical protein
MNNKFLGFLFTFAILGITACQPEASEPEATTPEATPEAPMTEAETTATPVNLPEGISLSEDGQTLVMEFGSTLEAYCSDGQGKLAISYVGEGGISGQALGCEQSFEPFDAARENGFANVNFVAPVVSDNALQLQAAEYVNLECRANQASLSPVLPENSLILYYLFQPNIKRAFGKA